MMRLATSLVSVLAARRIASTTSGGISFNDWKSPEDLRLIIGPRAGPVEFYQGDDFVEPGREP